MAASSLIGSLAVSLSMQTAAFTSGAKKAQSHLTGLEKSFMRIGEKVSAVGETLTKGLTVPLGGVAAAVIHTAANFEGAMGRVSISTQATAEQMKQMRELALKIGSDTSKSASEAADAMDMLSKAGMNTQNILGGGAKAAVALAEATGSELEPAAAAITDTMNQFKMPASALPQMINGITGAVNESKLSFEDFQLAMGQSGGVAGSLGVSFDDFTTAIAATSAMFASGSDAGTSFKTFLQRLRPATADAAAAMDEFGLKFFDAQGKMLPMARIAELLREKLAGLSDEAKNAALTEIFGSDAMRTAVGLMEQGAKGFEDMQKRIRATDAAKQAAERMKGFNAEMEKLKGAFETLAIRIADSGLLAMVTSLVAGVGQFIDTMSQASPEAFKLGVAIAAIAAAIGPVMMVLGPLISGLTLAAAGIRTFLLAFSASSALAGGALPAIGAALAPLLPLIAGVAAAAAAAYLVWKNWETIGPILQELWNYLVATIGPPLQKMIAAAGNFLDALWNGPLGQAVRVVIGVLAQLAEGIMRALGPVVVGIVKALGDVIGTVFGAIGDFLNMVAAILRGDFVQAWEHAKNLVNGILKGILSAFGNMLKGVWDGLKSFVSWALEKLGLIEGAAARAQRGIAKTTQAQVRAEDAARAAAVASTRVGGPPSTGGGGYSGGVPIAQSLVASMITTGVIQDVLNLWQVMQEQAGATVETIAREFARLDAAMVQPVKKAKDDAKEALRTLASDTRSLLGRLFPEVQKQTEFDASLRLLEAAGLDPAVFAAAKARLEREFAGLATSIDGLMDRLYPDRGAARRLRNDLALLDEAGLSAEERGKARHRLFMEAGARDPKYVTPLAGPGQIVNSAGEIVDATDVITQSMEGMGKQGRDTTAEMIKSFGDMATSVIGSLRGMVQSFKSGDILSGIMGLVDIISQVAGFFGGTGTSGGIPPGFGGFRAMGGPVAPGKSYIVGERGPEWFTPSRGGQIIPMNDNDGRRGAMKLIVEPSELFHVRLVEVEDRAATRGAAGGVAMSQRVAARAAGRRLA